MLPVQSIDRRLESGRKGEAIFLSVPVVLSAMAAAARVGGDWKGAFRELSVAISAAAVPMC